MNKHQLMLSAAVAVLCASTLAVQADTEISTSSTAALATTTAGNITITSAGAISVKSTGAVVTLDSNNSVTNNGVLVNSDNDGAIGVLIDTTDHNVVATTTGLLSTNTISVSGTGLAKTGVLVLGGNTYFGNITLNNITPLAVNGAGSTLTVTGDSVIGFHTVSASHVDGDVSFGGSITGLAAAKPTTGTAGPILASFQGTLYGNIYFDSTTAASVSGAGATGVVITGPVHKCADDATAEAAVGFVCGTGTSGLGALINAGKIVAVGQVFINPASKDPILEGGSALAVGASIDGGIYNGGPFTGNGNVVASAWSANGAGGQATVYIDPALAGTAAAPLKIGVVSSALDNIDPGYSFVNRGAITASPSAPQIGSAAMFVQGATPSIYTCFGNGDLAGCGSDGLGGILNTGAISASATTNATGVVTTNITASALVIGPYAAIPRLDLKAESLSLGAATSGSITASVSGTSGGIATAVSISQFARLPTINVGQGATISATVTTSNLTPTLEVAPSSAPFTMIATAITDGSSTLTTINNAGTISAAITVVTPGVGANVVTSVRAMDLTSSTANGITVNNSGKILGDMNYGAGGNNFALNVGNTGSSGGGGSANAATGVSNSPNNYAVVAYAIDGSTTGLPPTTEFNSINFGAGSGHVLHVGAYGYVNSAIKASPGALAVTVDPNGILFVANTTTTGSLNASNFDVNGGTLGLTISQNTTATTPVIRATTEATVLPNSVVALQFGSFISSGTTLASVTTPATQRLVLINSPVINITSTTLAQNNLILSQALPFLFQPSSAPLSLGTSAGNQTLELVLTPRVPGKGSGKADDSSAADIAGLGLSGDSLKQFPFVASALATDSSLGSAIATSLTVYNTPGVSSSKINVAASQQKAQQVFSQFGPDTSGGAKQVAILITDQASGPVAARQRLLRTYANSPGDLTLWGTEFGGNINNKGRVDADGTLTNYKDHGFGFSLGMDGGSPRGGWYGGAFTFYSGDVVQTLPRDTKTHTTWFMFSGYSDWKGKHLFLDTQLSAAYGDFKGTRDLFVGSTIREASGKRAALMGAAGVNMGAVFGTSRLSLTPHFSLDGLTLREEGYSESGGGGGLNLQVAPYYANSLRAALGVDLRTSMSLFGVTFSPEARVGYRYDLANSPVKLKAGFLSTGGVNTANNAMTFVGPDPDTGNLLGGVSLNFGTGTWHLGAHYDYLRGNNGSTSQVGTVSLLGRI